MLVLSYPSVPAIGTWPVPSSLSEMCGGRDVGMSDQEPHCVASLARLRTSDTHRESLSGGHQQRLI